MGSRTSGRRLNEYDYSKLKKKLFIRSDEFLRDLGMKYQTLWNRVSGGMFFSFKYGKYMYILNPCVDFDEHFDALPALLSPRDVCMFLCIEKISSKMANDIGFFRVAGESDVYTDKLSLAQYLMSFVRR